MADGKKTVTIIVEGTPHEWPKEEITYAEVVTLEVPDCAQHPEITYAVRTAELRGSDQVHVTGQLTVRGVSRPHTFTAALADVSADAVTLNAEFVIDRKDFGLDWNQLGMMKDRTTITAALRFTRQG